MPIYTFGCDGGSNHNNNKPSKVTNVTMVLPINLLFIGGSPYSRTSGRKTNTQTATWAGVFFLKIKSLVSDRAFWWRAVVHMLSQFRTSSYVQFWNYVKRRSRSGTQPRTCCQQSLLFVVSELDLTVSCKLHEYCPVG